MRVEFLGHISEQPWKPDPEGDRDKGVEHFLPRVDVERLNHVVLIDGGRGSGKTAVLMTLLHVWARQVQRKKDVPAFDSDERLRRLSARVVPIGLVDL